MVALGTGCRCQRLIGLSSGHRRPPSGMIPAGIRRPPTDVRIVDWWIGIAPLRTEAHFFTHGGRMALYPFLMDALAYPGSMIP